MKLDLPTVAGALCAACLLAGCASNSGVFQVDLHGMDYVMRGMLINDNRRP